MKRARWTWGVVLLLLAGLVVAAEDALDTVRTLGRECQAGNGDSCRRLVELARSAHDWQVRQAAVEKLCDMAVLAEIAEKDEERMVRLMAAQAIVCEQLFREGLAGSDEACDRLVGYAEQGQDPSLATAALWRVTGPDALARIVRNSPFAAVRIRIAEELADPALLAELARTDGEAAVVLAAVSNPLFADAALLAELARNSSQVEVRLAAAAKLTDPAALAAIARNDDSPAVRAAALKNPFFSDSTALAEMATKDGSPEVRAAAVGLLEDPHLFASIARMDPSAVVSRLALDRLSDQPLLAEIVQDAKSSSIRRCAALKLTDPSLLARIAQECPSEEVRLIAFLKLERRLSQELLPPAVIDDLTRIGQASMDPSANLSSSNFKLDQSLPDKIVCSVDIVNRSRIFHYRVSATFSAGSLSRTAEAEAPLEPGGKVSLSVEFFRSDVQGSIDVSVDFDADVLFLPAELYRITLDEEDDPAGMTI